MKRHLSYHACTGVSLTTSNYLVTRGTSYTTGLHDNNRGVRNSRCTGHMHSTLNETGFETQSVSTTNVVSGYMKNRVGGRQRSLSFLPFSSCREGFLLAGNMALFVFQQSTNWKLESLSNSDFGYFWEWKDIRITSWISNLSYSVSNRFNLLVNISPRTTVPAALRRWFDLEWQKETVCLDFSLLCFPS